MEGATDGQAKIRAAAATHPGEAKLVDACRAHDPKLSEVEGRIDAFLKSGERSLKARSEDEQAVHERGAARARAKVGELVLELDARGSQEHIPYAVRTASQQAVLGIVSRHPEGIHGYAVRRQGERHFWRLTFGEVYRILDRLAADGLIEHVTAGSE